MHIGIQYKKYADTRRKDHMNEFTCATDVLNKVKFKPFGGDVALKYYYGAWSEPGKYVVLAVGDWVKRCKVGDVVTINEELSLSFRVEGVLITLVAEKNITSKIETF